MSPQLIAALLSVSVRILDFLDARGTLTPEDLAAREVIRKEMVRQALAEGSGDPEPID